MSPGANKERLSNGWLMMFIFQIKKITIPSLIWNIVNAEQFKQTWI